MHVNVCPRDILPLGYMKLEICSGLPLYWVFRQIAVVYLKKMLTKLAL